MRFTALCLVNENKDMNAQAEGWVGRCVGVGVGVRWG